MAELDPNVINVIWLLIDPRRIVKAGVGEEEKRQDDQLILAREGSSHCQKGLAAWQDVGGSRIIRKNRAEKAGGGT
jgi:hypothetical protein